ncbi:MAG: 2,3-epoxybenzoyl-CoA dihydrolase [Planctomycetes bacterium]|nr:2,3-epoxybenzoyl-CoA dihydrolase [Planctomycetota bacterium]MCC7397306.1 benzoyl-CoA-dihydrodiol lyase [Planctomycetota bacterium]
MTDFNRHPSSYHHWQLQVDGDIAHLRMNVDPNHPYQPGYELKLNSYDLGVDMELADAVQRLRFEHPAVRVVVVGSAQERAFCAGANIWMLAESTHPFKVNFCKFTNETRLSLEDASRNSGLKAICAINAACAGGGYELALACDEIHLVNDNNSAVSLPEVPLLGVLPGTGGLTRIVDKRKVRRDRADVFCTMAEGLRGKKALAWGFVDAIWPKSQFAEKVQQRAKALAASQPARPAQGITLDPIHAKRDGDVYQYQHVRVEVDTAHRLARLTVHGPSGAQPKNGAGYEQAGSSAWALQCYRELDDALLQLRFDHEEVGLIVLQTRGDREALLQVERDLWADRGHWLCNEILLQMARTLRRFDLMARSTYALVDADSCCAGAFFELTLASDRVYALDDDKVVLAIGPLSDGALPMSHGLTRLHNRFLAQPQHAQKLAKEPAAYTAAEADEQGLCTYLLDPVDWDDDVRIALEERASLSPDALTGMEASLRFGGAENCDSKIFGRLSAWQNWIFTRPNATGDEGALTRYGAPESARFDWRRT